MTASLADPEVRTALRPAVRGEVRVPTRSEGETLDDLLADRSAVEDVDADAAGEQGYGCVRPVQPPVEHLLGARYRPLERGLT